MATAITITHKVTAKKASTTLRMPGRGPITKTWLAQADGSYMLDTCQGWEDEDLPDEVQRAVEYSCTDICWLMDDIG